MKKLIFIFTLLTAILLPTGCFNDLGNYDYTELDEITITGLPDELELLGFVDNITLIPTITSLKEGIIGNNHPNYTVLYEMRRTDANTMPSRNVFDTLNTTGNFSIDILAAYPPGRYQCWMRVIDKRTGISTSHFTIIVVGSTTNMGWMVLCNEGPQERVRLDFISRISSERIETIYDVAQGLPTLHHATQLGFQPMAQSPGNQIIIFSKEGSYHLNFNTLASDELSEFNLNNFIFSPGELMTHFSSFAIRGDNAYNHRYSVSFSVGGNVYCRDNTATASSFGSAINTTEPGTPPEFRVAPYFGFSEVRDGTTGPNGTSAMLYDIDNKRFVAFRGAVTGPNVVSGANSQRLSPLVDGPDDLFSWQTGKELVYMEGTRYGQGNVYAILENSAGERSLCGVDMSGTGFFQNYYQEVVTAPDFKQAEHFAFHSQFPLMYYATSSKVYVYNLATQVTTDITSTVVNSGEEVTRIRFNLHRHPRLVGTGNGPITDQSPENINRQFHLVACTFNSAAGINGGRVGIYQVPLYGAPLTRTEQYTGFAKIKDIVYKVR